MQTLGLDVGRQAIIRRDADTFALYTLTDAESELSVDTVRMGRGGRGRLDGAEEEQFVGSPRQRGGRSGSHPAGGLGGEKLLELLIDDQAEHVRDLLSDLGVSCWRCKGWKPGGGAVARWHITSTDISTASFPQLATVAAREFHHAVSFHGFTEDGRPDILIGGQRPTRSNG